MAKYKIRWKNLTTQDWDEETVEALSLEKAEEMAREAWFDVNDPAYFAELL